MGKHQKDLLSPENFTTIVKFVCDDEQAQKDKVGTLSGLSA